MQEGSMRCDVNVSVRPQGQEELGTKVEVKNMNSFSAMQRAIDFEIDRQVWHTCKSDAMLLTHERQHEPPLTQCYFCNVMKPPTWKLTDRYSALASQMAYYQAVNYTCNQG